MKLLFFYTLDYIRRNRRSSLAIVVAILMASTMLSALCGFLYNIYADNLNLILRENGNWHGELFDTTLGSQLSTVEGFESVEAVMLKGRWKTARISDPRRSYLVWRDANAAYWDSMPEGGGAILEGRAPARAGEIALSKQYFEYHPALALGDTITLPVGERVAADGSPMEQQGPAQPGERFVAEGTAALTVVGKLDVATSSTVPAYTALGFLDPAAVAPGDELTVYLRFHNIRDTYRELPKIAAAVGFVPDEYGNYPLRYNTEYLSRKAVFSPKQARLAPLLLASQMPLMFAAMGLMTVGLFVLIIHNAFALSSAARLSQLGIFASVGATPRQIKRSVILEGLLLTAVALPLGILLGQCAVGFLIGLANHLGGPGEKYPMEFAVGWQPVLPAALLSLLTVWWSALIPARRVARMEPIAAIRQGSAGALKKPRRFSPANLGKLFGLPGELAANALQARRKSYRTAFVSLTLSFLTLACFLCITSASTASMAIYRTEEAQWAEQDIRVTLHNIPSQEDFSAVTGQIGAVDGVMTASWYSVLRTAVWLPEAGFSAEFKEKGGFATVEKYLSGSQVPLLRDGRRRVDIALLGLDDATFAAYCHTLGADPAPYYEQGHWRGILYHTVNDVASSTKRHPVPIPFFNIAPGDSLTLTEATRDSYEGDFTFGMEAAAIAGQPAPLGGATFGKRYSAVQYMPMGRARALAANFAHSGIATVYGVIRVADPARITPARNAVEQICESSFGSGDYNLLDENEYFANQAAGKATTALMFGFVVGVLAIIGLSNAWATVRGSLHARRREFAMLRSVGLPPRGLRRMLWLEALILGLTPVLLSLPLAIALQGVFLYINEVSFVEWLPFAPWQPVLLYIAAVLAVTAAAYATGGREVLHENIIETIKTDFI